MSKKLQIALTLISSTLAAFVLGKLTNTVPFVLLAVIVGSIAAFITFLKPANGLLLIVFAMLLSPEIPLMQMPGRAVVIRIDDIIIVMVFLAWLANTAVDKNWKGFEKTPLDLPILAYILVCVLFSARGVMIGNVKAVRAAFYVMKYIEYFILYWMVVNITVDLAQVKKFIIAGIITCVITTLYAYSLFPTAARVFPPFDTDGKNANVGESASLAGYLLIIMAITLGMILNDPSSSRLVWLGLFFVFMVPPFIRTLSRSTYYAFFPMVVVVIFFSERRKLLLLSSLILGALILPWVAPKLYTSMADRFHETFTGKNKIAMGSVSVNLEESAALRLRSWKQAFTEWLPPSPLTGRGIASVGIVDTQYALILGETGIVGLTVFLWLLFSIGINALRSYKKCKQPLHRALSLGVLASLAGLMVQSLGVNSFVVIRIMEPFWFLTALVMKLPELEQNNNGLNPA